MEVRPGYKLTEVGVIPEDWGVRSVQEIGKIKTGPFGTLLKASEYSDGEGVPLISVGEVGNGRFRITDDTPRVPISVVRRLPQYVLRAGDIVFGRKGAVDRSALVSLAEEGWFLGSDGISVRPSGICHPPYLAAQFQSWLVQSWLIQNAIGTTMPSLNQGILGRVQIPYALKAEQQAIATTLSDIDALIDGLTQLITKKRDIKQAAMQQLLTGKTRLPGFSGKWEVKRLGDHLSFMRNGVNSRAELVEEGTVKYLHYGDIHGAQDVYLNPRAAIMPFLPEAKADGLARLRDGDLVFADASEDLAGVGKAIEVQGASGVELVAGQHTIAVRFDKAVLADGFKAYLQYIPSFHRHLRRLAAGTKVYATNRAYIAGAELELPSAEEQIAVAAVFTDMDKELAVLESRLTKTRALKQGMMQELLTGRTRLVEPSKRKKMA